MSVETQSVFMPFNPFKNASNNPNALLSSQNIRSVFHLANPIYELNTKQFFYRNFDITDEYEYVYETKDKSMTFKIGNFKLH